MNVSEILRMTKQKMQGKWKLAFTVTAVVTAIIMIVPLTLTPALGGLEGIANLAWMFTVSFPVGTGAMWLFLDLLDGMEGNLNSIFDVFLDLKRIMSAWALKMLLVAAHLLLFVIPGFIALINYSQMEFILKDNPEINAREALWLSKEMMHGNKMRYCLLYLRIFWPVILLMTMGYSIIANLIWNVASYGGEVLLQEIWIHETLLRRALVYLLLGGLGKHVLNTYARPAFAVFYRDLKPLEIAEESEFNE